MIKDQWTDVNSPFAFGGQNAVYDHYHGAIKRKKIESELSKLPTYTLHKQTKRVINTNPVFVYKPHQIWESDICYLPRSNNKKFRQKYLYCVIEVFSRKLFVRVLDKKDTKSSLEAFKEIHNFIGKTPQMLYVDRGGEYTNKLFKKYCKDKNINLVFSYSQYKSPHIERSQATLQNILYKIMEEKQTLEFLPLVDKALKIYNNHRHRIIKMSPNEAYLSENESLVRENLEEYYSKALSKRVNPKLKEGDHVRVSLKRGLFKKGYFSQFSEEVFQIKKVLTNLPQPRYILESLDGEEIKGSFYEREITKSNHEIFKIEKILKTRKLNGKKQYFVKWLGYSSNENSWVDEKDIKTFKSK